MSYKGKTVIGITGGIGSGKTKVLELLDNNFNAMIIEADRIGHELQEPGQVVYNKIVDAFGEEILDNTDLVAIQAQSDKTIERKIDRKKLGAIVFADNYKLLMLNSITHPAIHKHINELISKSDKKLIFIEAAILTESSLVELTDALWFVYADMPVRLERLQKYREVSSEKAMQIMANQPDEKYFREKCDVVIDNSFTEVNTLKQLEREIKKIQEEHYE